MKEYAYGFSNLNDLLRIKELISSIIRKLINDAETYLGDSFESAVITLTEYFNESQRQATKDSAILAVIKVDRILNELSLIHI